MTTTTQRLLRALRPRARAAFLLALPAVCHATAACRPAQAPLPEIAPLRLLESGQDAEIRWGRRRGERIPEGVNPARIGDLPAPGRVSRVAMFAGLENRDSRAALLAPTGSVQRFVVELPREPLLRLGLGYAIVPEHVGRAVRYEVVVETATGERATVLERTLEVASDGVWEDVEIALDRWRGQRVTLELGNPSPKKEPPVWAAWSAPEIVSRQGRQAGWDVILISIDTLRADRLSSYGHRRPTSPHLDALAARGVRFANAVSQAPWTRPAHRALLTGLYPISDGGRMSPALAWVLWLNGYRTRAITGGGQIDDRFGFHDGFERYEVKDWLRRPEAVVDWLEAGRGRRDLLFLHTFEVHDPYDHTEFAEREGLPAGRIQKPFNQELWLEWEGRLDAAERAYVEALYDGGIAFTDRQIGKLLETLETRGLLERTIVVVTSDHGEELFEHGSWRHGSNLYEHQLHVPLILYVPPALQHGVGGSRSAFAGRVVDAQVRSIDVYPTLLDLLGVPLEHAVNGRSLRPVLLGEPLAPEPALAENTNSPLVERKSLRFAEAKLVYSYPRGSDGDPQLATRELYDLRRDPAERVNLAEQRPELVARLESELRALIGGGAAAEGDREVPADLDPDLRRRLEALGYLEP